VVQIKKTGGLGVREREHGIGEPQRGRDVEMNFGGHSGLEKDGSGTKRRRGGWRERPCGDPQKRSKEGRNTRGRTSGSESRSSLGGEEAKMLEEDKAQGGQNLGKKRGRGSLH